MGDRGKEEERERRRGVLVRTWVDSSWSASRAPSNSQISFPAFGLPRSWYSSGVQIVLSCSGVWDLVTEIVLVGWWCLANVGVGRALFAGHCRELSFSRDPSRRLRRWRGACVCLQDARLVDLRAIVEGRLVASSTSKCFERGGHPSFRPTVDSPGRTQRERASRPPATGSPRICWHSPQPSSLPLRASPPGCSLIPRGDGKLPSPSSEIFPPEKWQGRGRSMPNRQGDDSCFPSRTRGAAWQLQQAKGRSTSTCFLLMSPARWMGYISCD